MQENTKHEFARIDAENKAERFRMQLESQQAMDVLRIQISQLIEANKAMQASQTDTSTTLNQPVAASATAPRHGDTVHKPTTVSQHPGQ